MRNYIFEFKQDKAIEFGLKTNDLLLLDYMLKFFNTDQIKRQKKEKNFIVGLLITKF